MALTVRAKLDLVSFFLRSGLGIVFLYAAISGMINPSAWVSFVPAFIAKIIPAKNFIILFAVYQILLTIWLFSKWQPFKSATLTSITLLGIAFFNVGGLDIVFRDIAILLSAIALAVIHYKEK